MKSEKLELKIQKNVPLAKYTTFKIGGPAKYFFEAKTKKDIIKATLWAKKQRSPFFILGKGSNVLFSDKGFDGLVIKIQSSKFKKDPTGSRQRRQQNSKIIVEAGVLLNQVAISALKNNLTGLEWTAGIPGTVGGAIKGNAGAFGKAMKDIVKEVEVFDCKEEKVIILKNKSCQFGYRDSVFQDSRNLIILSAKLQLKKGRKLEIEKKTKEYLAYRKKGQPLNLPSAGSIFQNPKSKIQNPKLLTKFPQLREFNKRGFLPAGFLIEKCDLKGKKVGGAKISEKHANFIVNVGEAKALDVLKLIELAKKKVKKKFKISLKEEIKIISLE